MTTHLRSRRGLLLAMALVTLFVTMLAGACQCDNHQHLEPKFETTLTDGKDPERAPLPEGSTCTHMCDCQQGEDCEKGRCVIAPGTIPVYCCSNPGCTFGQKCFFRDGREARCTAGVPCTVDTDCNPASCQNSGNDCTQISQKCSQGLCQESRIPVSNSICQANQCVPKTTGCKVHCDCAQGQFCNNGTCQVGDSPVYCCSKPGCPAKSACYQTDGSVGVCAGTGCKTDSDCGTKSCNQQGSICNELQPTCQPDGTCNTQTRRGSGTCNAATGTCRLTQPCRTHCDCNQGETCIQGACAPLSSRQTFCCTKSGCPEGKACFDQGGAPGVCKPQPKCQTDLDCPAPSCRQANNNTDCIAESAKCDVGTAACQAVTQFTANATCDQPSGKCIPRQPPECKVDCDCPQSFLCSQGKCLSGTQAVYCCDKTGCPDGKSCSRRDGSKGSCPSTNVCKTDADCGKASCRNSGNDCITAAPTCDIATGKCSNVDKTTTNATCNAANATCTPRPTICASHCDCPQGSYCSNRTCQRSSFPYYCCDNKGCPASANCVSRSGQQGFCPTPCTSPCDCPAGQSCLNGACAQASSNLFCCDDTQNCPSGAACADKANKSGTCPTAPRTCQGACDCVQGEACISGTCQTGTKPTYCCDKAGCVPGQGCVSKSNLSGVCPKTCKTHCDCDQGQNCLSGRCNSDPINGRAYCCSKPGCPLQQFCYQTNGQFGRCPATRCTSPCDCQAGQDCRNGTCINTSPAVYCCDTPKTCPSGQACQDKNNKWGTCATTVQCTSPCDCPQGQDCLSGSCVGIFPAVYCCSKTGCQAGQTCYDSNNTPGSCPGSTCTTACDCPVQGQSCVRGRCVYLTGGARIYCCDKPFCPAGNKCEDKTGAQKTCSQTSCKTPCDCNQGEDCRNNQCVLVSPRVYCCSKAGCPRRASCSKTDGSRSTCGAP